MKRHPHETTISALFRNPVDAQKGIEAIEPLKFDPADISLILSQEAYQKEEIVKVIGSDYLHEEAVHAGKIGGIMGAILGGLTAVTAAISGGTSLLIAGPIVAVIATAGGLLGSLIGAGFTEQEAQVIDAGIREGDVLLVVHAEDKSLAKKAEEILEKLALKVRHHH